MIIYKTTNLINGKIYIGQDKNNNPNYYGSGDLIKNAIRKYGKKYFTKDILCVCETIDELNSKEKQYIEEYNSTNKNIGYNISFGGTNGTMLHRKHTNETKLKMKNSSLGKKKSESHCKNIGLSKKGIPLTIEHKQKISNSNPLKGKKIGPHSIDVRKKISMTKKGKKMSDETKLKMSKSHMGIKNHFYGKKHSEEFMETKRKKIIQLTINGEFIKEWNSLSEASKILGIYIGNISNVLRGKYKTTGGFKFKYKNNE
jgi:group I intron endonuclease